MTGYKIYLENVPRFGHTYSMYPQKHTMLPPPTPGEYIIRGEGEVYFEGVCVRRERFVDYKLIGSGLVGHDTHSSEPVRRPQAEHFECRLLGTPADRQPTDIICVRAADERQFVPIQKAVTQPNDARADPFDVNTDDRVAGTDGCGIVSRMREADVPSIDLGIAFGTIVNGRFIAKEDTQQRAHG